MSERVALVTLALGERYERRWRQVCEPRWREYAERHGYDVVCLTAPLDDSERAQRRSPAWQKCLVLEQPFAAAYDRVVWVDADIAINPAAPAIADGVPPELVGAVDEYSSPTPELHDRTMEKLYAHWDATGVEYVDNLTPADYYAAFDLPPRSEGVVQTGAMVLSPARHAGILRDVYDRYEDRGQALNYEMRPLSWELLEAGLVHWIDPAFNCIWGATKALRFPFLLSDPDHPDAARAAAAALADCHLLHFAGNVDELELIATAEAPLPLRVAPPPSAAAPEPVRAPVVMAVYGRPDLTKLVLDAVRPARPRRLFVLADAPPEGDEIQAELCARTLALFDGVDWDCEVEIDVAATHLGAASRLGGGLTRVLGEVEEAIVLEDDCVPEPTFFRFCDELLERYREDDRVMAISGDDYRPRLDEPQLSYTFSRYPLIWGWATWRRAWSGFDQGMEAWAELREDGWLERLLDDPVAATYWTHQLDRVAGGLDAWDYPWAFACWRAGGLTALPTRNLVSNLGFRADATHTRPVAEDGRSPFAAMPTEPMPFPLRHPDRVERDEATDRFIEDVAFSGNLRRMMGRVRRAHNSREKAWR